MVDNLFSNDLLNKIAISIIGGFCKDGVKAGFVRLSAIAKEKLKELVPQEEKQNILLKALDEVSEEVVASKKHLIQYLKTQIRPINIIHGDYIEVGRTAKINNNGQNVGIIKKQEIHFHYDTSEKKKELTETPPNIKKAHLSQYLSKILQSHQDKINRKFYYINTEVEGNSCSANDGIQHFPLNFQIEREQNEQKKIKIEKLDAIEGIRKYAEQHIILEGNPGMGKSTTLSLLAYEEADKGSKGKEAYIPVLIELRSLIDDRYPTGRCDENGILAVIKDKFNEAGIVLREDEIIQFLKEKKILLLFDGINELPSDNARMCLDEFIRKFQECPMVLTTRNLSEYSVFDHAIKHRFKFQPLTKEQIANYLVHYFPNTYQQIFEAIQDKFKDLFETPMFLEMLCVKIVRNGTAIPENRGRLIHDFIKQVYETEFKRHVKWIKFPTQEEMLERLAFDMVDANGNKDLLIQIIPQKADNIFKKYLQEEKVQNPSESARKWRDLLVNHHLLQSTSKHNLEFRHQLLQEYYAGRYLLKILEIKREDSESAYIEFLEEIKIKYLNYLKWTEPFALLLNLVKEKQLALEIVKAAFEVDLFLGAKLVGSVDNEFQSDALQFIMISAVSLDVKIYLLGITKSQNAILLLKEIFDNNENKSICESVTEILRNINNEDDVPALIQAGKDKSLDSYIPNCVADVLMKIGDKKIIAALIKISSPNSVKTLREIGGREVVIGLIKALQDRSLHSSWYSYSKYCCEAARILGEFGDKEAVPSLIQLLHHNYLFEDDLFSVVNALGQIGDKKAVAPLIDVLQNQNLCESLRHQAIRALGKIGDKEAVGPLSKAFHDPSLHMYEDDVPIAKALGEIGGEEAVTALIKAMQDPSLHPSDDRIPAIDTLGEIGGNRAVTALIEALQDLSLDSYARSCVVEALGEIGGNRAVTALIEALQDLSLDSYARSCVVEALGEIGGEEIILILAQYLRYDKIDTEMIPVLINAIVNLQNKYKLYNPTIRDSNKYVI